MRTMWVKWGLDKSYARSTAVQALEEGWAFKAYSSQYPLLTLQEYEVLVVNSKNWQRRSLGTSLKPRLGALIRRVPRGNDVDEPATSLSLAALHSLARADADRDQYEEDCHGGIVVLV